MTVVTVTTTITAGCLLNVFSSFPLPFLSFAHLLDCCRCYYYSILGYTPRKRTRPLARKTVSTNTHTHTHVKSQCICLPVHRIVWTDGEIDGIDERGIQANEETNDDYHHLRCFPKVIVDRLTESVHTASAFLFCLSVFSTQVNVRMNGCCEREEQTNEALVDSCSMKRDQEKGLQPVGIPAFNLMMA